MSASNWCNSNTFFCQCFMNPSRKLDSFGIVPMNTYCVWLKIDPLPSYRLHLAFFDHLNNTFDSHIFICDQGIFVLSVNQCSVVIVISVGEYFLGIRQACILSGSFYENTYITFLVKKGQKH